MTMIAVITNTSIGASSSGFELGSDAGAKGSPDKVLLDDFDSLDR